MPALNFKPQFSLHVQDGTKRQTIRAERKREIKVGDKLYFYTGMRTKKCRKLGEAVCSKVIDIEFWDSGAMLIGNSDVEIKYPQNDKNFLDDFARADGFALYELMHEWFRKTHGLPFQGQIIYW